MSGVERLKLLKQIGLKLPVLRKSQACEACGETFACEIALGKGCWCGEIKLSDETRQELRAKYRNCLCRACLEKAAATNSTSEINANAHD
jgi:Cysteine-rich CWC